MHAPQFNLIHNEQRKRCRRRTAACAFRRKRLQGRRAFSLTELLVVIGIIILLVGLLLVALKQVQVKTKRSRTESTMQQFANACVAFQAENGFYPGVIPDDVLAANTPCPISSTENALLHLMGGYRVVSPSDPSTGPVQADYNTFVSADPSNVRELIFNPPSGTGTWKLAINLSKIGEGPVINGKARGPYFTPGPDALLTIEGQYGEMGAQLPDLVDAWEHPIVFIKRVRDRGPLLRDPTVTGSPPLPQFTLVGTEAYLRLNWATGTTEQGLLVDGYLDDVKRANTWAAVLGHPAFYKKPTSSETTAPLYGQAKGDFMLLSAGPDGVYFSVADGPGSAGTPINSTNVDALIINIGPRVIDDFDDVRFYGGG
jgi:type II secretory pathway pseudopilin PulG